MNNWFLIGFAAGIGLCAVWFFLELWLAVRRDKKRKREAGQFQLHALNKWIEQKRKHLGER